MAEISLFNAKGRDAVVATASVRTASRIRRLDADDRPVTSVRILKGTLDRDFSSLLAKYETPEKLGEALVEGDPEIDIESCGSFLKDTARVYVNSDRKIVYGVTEIEIVRNPDGSEKSRRPKKANIPNVGAEMPIPWSGKLLPKSEVYRKFVMVSKLRIVHTNGLTYDFLFEIAKELEAKKSLLLLGAGPKGNQRIVFRHGATPYTGFLEGRTRGEEYCLLLHLSNIELKAKAAQEAKS